MAKFQLKAKSFKKMEDPINRESGRVKYVCYIKANSIPDSMEDWMSTNPREQKMTTNVAKNIQDSLDRNQDFHELNRGILMSVEEVTYDNKEGIVTIEMDNPDSHGNIDGGHTLRAILEAKNSGTLNDNRYVFFEFLTGIDSPVELAAARNTSVQVDLKSIEELSNSFEVIKKVLEDQPFANRIGYKMNQQFNGKTVIDVREILAIINMFNQALYPIKTKEGGLLESQPIQSYTGKEASLKKFINLGEGKREQIILDMQPVIGDIFELWDNVERNFGAEANRSGRRYGSRKYSKFDNNKVVGKALFSEEELKYIVPKGLIYPIVAAFRALININPETNKYCWKKDPLEAWDVLGQKLIAIVLDEKADNPEVLGKNNNLWSNLFKEVLIYGYGIG